MELFLISPFHFVMETTFVGICSIDLYSQCPRLPELGETLHGTRLDRGFGGKASNACVQFAYLSQDNKPNMITAVGNDASGTEIIDHFKECGLNTQGVCRQDRIPTGLAICFVLEGGESAIVIHACPVTHEIIQQNMDKIKNSKLLVTNFEIGVPSAVEVLKLAHEAGVTTILNAAPMPTDIDRSIFKFCSIVIVNQIEMRALGTVDDLFDLGVNVVIVTLGAEGAAIHEKGKAEIRVKSPTVKAVDTTGAGDSFVGSFTYCLSRNKGYEDAARFACVAASISVQNVGTQQSYAHFDHPQIKELLI